MPQIVATGRKPDVMECGVCHRADGSGGPENASLSGLSAEYIIRQTQEFLTGQRSASKSRVPTDLIIKTAKSVTDKEVAEAADYFPAIQPRANVKVLETDTVPKTEVRDLFLNAIADARGEPIGQRIIELPEPFADFVSWDTHVSFVAYVPTHGVGKGEALAKSNDPKFVFVDCHGQGLEGSDLAPRLAGRSPTYLFRKLYDFKVGGAEWSNCRPDENTLETLCVDDMSALAAYAGSLSP